MAILGQRPGVMPAGGKEGQRVGGGQSKSLTLSSRVTLKQGSMFTKVLTAGQMAQPLGLEPGILSTVLRTVCVVGGETGSLQAALWPPHMYPTIHFFLNKIPLKSWTASLEISRASSSLRPHSMLR